MKLVDNGQKVVYIKTQKMDVNHLELEESMISINFKKLIWKIFLIFWNIFAIIGLVVSGYFLYLVFDEKGYCLSSQHGVWDDNQKICRTDCLKWDKDTGCIKKENLQKKQ